jgi:sulfonate transport system substrate-binding protein
MKNFWLRFAYGFSLLTLAALFVGTADAAEGGKKYGGLKVRWATQPSQTQAAIAEELGYFKEEFEADGVTIELRVFASGPPIIEAFAAGELDFGQVGNQPAIQAIANGIKINIIGAYMSSDGSHIGLLARKDAGITSLTDLRGRKVGYTVGSEAHQLLLQFLASANLTEDDVRLINLQVGDINTSLESGAIDAAVTWEPYLTGILNNGTTRLVQSGVGFKNSSSIIIGKTDFLEKYPEITARILKVLDRSVKWSDAHKEEAIKLLSKRTGVAESAYAASFRSLNFELYLDRQRIDALLFTEKFLLGRKTIRKEINLRDYINTKFLEAAGVNKK